MSKESTKRAAHLAALLQREFPAAIPHLVADAVIMMQRETRGAKSRAERECNEPDFDGSKRDKAAEKRVNAALEKAGICTRPTAQQHMAWVKLGGDPRGACGWLRSYKDGVEMQGDGWGDGFAIY